MFPFGATLLLLEALVILLMGVFVRFSETGQLEHIATHANLAENQMGMLPFAQNVDVMVFVGFGFLMVFLKYHNWTSVGLNLMVAQHSDVHPLLPLLVRSGGRRMGRLHRSGRDEARDG